MSKAGAHRRSEWWAKPKWHRSRVVGWFNLVPNIPRLTVALCPPGALAESGQAACPRRMVALRKAWDCWQKHPKGFAVAVTHGPWPASSHACGVERQLQTSCCSRESLEPQEPPEAPIRILPVCPVDSLFFAASVDTSTTLPRLFCRQCPGR